MRGIIALGMGLLAAAPTLALAGGQARGCPNCEAVVTLAPGSAQSFADVLQILNSMPLHGVVLDDGAASGAARVLAATEPDYAAKNHLDSFDVAKKVVEFAADPRYGIQSVTASWQRAPAKARR